MNINFVIWDIIQSSLFFKLCSSNCFSLTIGKSFSWLLSLFFFIFYILASIWAFSLSFSLSVSIPSPFFTLSSLLSVITRYSRVKAASIFCYRAKMTFSEDPQFLQQGMASETKIWGVAILVSTGVSCIAGPSHKADK